MSNFRPGQQNRASADVHGAGCAVEPEPLELDHGSGLGEPAAAGQCLHTGEQLLGVKRLGKIVMPPLGTELVDDAGMEAVRAFIQRF